ncbi:glycine zipper domain-containing protein [Chitinophaga alhagiae]|uniref:glycine zipper domain-containing protein n=1 Tax=Chitinophaga alhagiae TaxID=2203219 RepID=UPI000E5AA290|nr:glycine zipper domain-containing protein [Chitinophaga alhagiae]
MKQLLTALAAVSILASCGGNADTAAIESARKATIDSMNAIAAAKQHVIDSMNAVKANRTKAASFNSHENTAAAPVTETAAAPAPAKKKWSHTAKGAVVGAGAGAITGAIVNKDRVKGAAIGTIIGAGVGAGTGAIVDKQVKKKQAQQ